MKQIRSGLILLSALIPLFVFTSCEDDGYSLGDFVISLATVNPIDENAGTYSLTLDNGKTLWPAASNVLYRPKSNQRVIVNYTILGDSMGEYDHPVKINSMREILTKEIEDLTPDNQEEIGNDPIKILALWTGDDYLNIRFGYNTGGEERHRISLVHNKINPVVNEDGTIVLEFRHNAYNDPEYYGVNNYAAYNLRPLQTEGQDEVNLLIKVQDFNNEIKEYKVAYKYKNLEETTQNKTFTNMPGDIDIY